MTQNCIQQPCSALAGSSAYADIAPTKFTPQSPSLEFRSGIGDQFITWDRYHAAGQVVAAKLVGHRPAAIAGGTIVQHPLTVAPLQKACGPRSTPRVRERAVAFAECLLAGDHAEAVASGCEVDEIRTEAAMLRNDAGDGNEVAITAYERAVSLLSWHGSLKVWDRVKCVRKARLELAEQRAIVMMQQPEEWAAVVSVAEELHTMGGSLGYDQVRVSIERGLTATSVACPEPQVSGFVSYSALKGGV